MGSAGNRLASIAMPVDNTANPAVFHDVEIGARIIASYHLSRLQPVATAKAAGAAFFAGVWLGYEVGHGILDGSRGLESKTDPIVVRIGLGTVYINFA